MPPAPIPANESARLATLRSYAILHTPPERIYDDITQLASVMCEAPISLISFVDSDRQWFKSAVGLKDRETCRDESFCAHTLAEGNTLVVEDTLNDPRFLDNPLVTHDPGMRFYAGVPLIAPNGHVLGTICVIDTKPRTLSPDKLHALQLLSVQIVARLETRVALLESRRAAAALMHSEKLAAVGRLAASMSHEIKNPLETVSNLVYLARHQVQDQEVAEWLDQAETELHRITTVTNQALLFGQNRPVPRSATCSELISTALGIFEGRLRHSGVTVEQRRRADQPVLCFDGDICQALGHLVANAIDAMPTGGRLLIRSRIATRWDLSPNASKPPRGIVLTLADTGTGVSAEIGNKIFEPFFTTKPNEGNGLGLWIANDTVRRHHGSISIRSSQHPAHSGTVVSIFLPLQVAPDPIFVPVEDTDLKAALYGEVYA